MKKPHVRQWVGQCSFPSLRDFYLGTVEAASEMEAEGKLKALWKTIIPCEPPRTIICLPGSIILCLDDET